jgi:peptidoglycan/LPS O-acetylase OafA/YrhL
MKKLQTTNSRISIIDAARGIASLMVVFYHLDEAVGDYFSWIPTAIRSISQNGNLGVAIFFVLSGYVIALSTETLSPSFKNLGVFAIRRGIRLDPPYWFSIALAVGLTQVSNKLFPETLKALPSLPQAMAHIFYAQNILNLGDIVAVYWSLCFEIQMYLFFISLTFFSRWAQGKLKSQRWKLGFGGMWGITYVSSVFWFFSDIPNSANGWFFAYWFMFLLGAIIRWSNTKQAPISVAIASLILVLGFPSAKIGYKIAVTCTALLLFSSKRKTFLNKWMEIPPLLFLGKLSYSLYLIHPIIGWRSISLMKELAGPEISPLTSVVIFCLGIAFSILGAWFTFRFIEAPAMQFSKKIAKKWRPTHYRKG